MIFGLFSAKGGVGKTTLAITLGHTLSSFSQDQLVIDANLRTANIGLFLGTSDLPNTFNQVLSGEKKIDEVTYLHPSGMHFVPAISKYDAATSSSKSSLAKLKKSLLSFPNTQSVIIDTPSGLFEELTPIVRAVDKCIVVTTAEMPALVDTSKMIKFIEDNGGEVVGIILNQFRGYPSETEPENITALLEKPLLGVVPYDSLVSAALKMYQPVSFVDDTSPASTAVKAIATNLLNLSFTSSLTEKNKSGVTKVLEKFAISQEHK